MYVCAGHGAVMLCRPLLGIDGFRDAEVERELRNDLPSETDICSAAQAIDGRDGEGVEYIVFVEINAVRPFAGIEALQAEPYG